MKQRRPWQWMYSTTQWRYRRLEQLKRHPLCAACLKLGVVREARVVHHVTAHKGNWQTFCDADLESLCKQCHDQHTASVERAGLPVKQRTGLDGWPVEEKKP